jgi:ribosomal protein L32
MGKPKKRTSARRSGMRQSHLVLKLARAVNAKSPIKVHTTRRETGNPAAKTTKAVSPAPKTAEKLAEADKKAA